MRLAAAALLLCSCATLDTMGMSESCKNAYNSCLNSCPDAARFGSPTPPPNAVTGPDKINPQIAGCTDDCNRRARTCK